MNVSFDKNMDLKKLSIVMPAYNEGGGIEKTLRKTFSVLQNKGFSFEVIVVNNGSTDNSKEVLTTLQKEFPELKVISVMPNRNYGGGIKAGLENATGNILGWTDADGQVDPKGIVDLYHLITDQGFKVAKAYRHPRIESKYRKFQSNVFNTIFKLFFGNIANDINAKPKLMAREIYEKFPLESNDIFIDAEWVIKLAKAKIPMGNAPVPFLKREFGKSKMRFWTSLEFLYRMVYYFLRVKN